MWIGVILISMWESHSETIAETLGEEVVEELEGEYLDISSIPRSVSVAVSRADQ